MKKLLAGLLLAFPLAALAAAPKAAPAPKVLFAQTANGPSATITWTEPTGLPTGTTSNVYKCAGTPCTALTSFTLLASGLAVGGPYVDTAVTVGQYSYYVVNVNGTATSAASSIATGTLPLPAPTGVTVTVSQ